MSAVPWYAEADWEPPAARMLGRDYRLEADLRAWTQGKPLTPGLQHVPWTSDGGGFLLIRYDDGTKHGALGGSWMVSGRQAVTGRDFAVFGYGSLVAALEDCVEMARDYERDDLIELAMPGLS